MNVSVRQNKIKRKWVKKKLHGHNVRIWTLVYFDSILETRAHMWVAVNAEWNIRLTTRILWNFTACAGRLFTSAIFFFILISNSWTSHFVLVANAEYVLKNRKIIKNN